MIPFIAPNRSKKMASFPRKRRTQSAGWKFVMPAQIRTT